MTLDTYQREQDYQNADYELFKNPPPSLVSLFIVDDFKSLVYLKESIRDTIVRGLTQETGSSFLATERFLVERLKNIRETMSHIVPEYYGNKDFDLESFTEGRAIIELDKPYVLVSSSVKDNENLVLPSGYGYLLTPEDSIVPQAQVSEID